MYSILIAGAGYLGTEIAKEFKNKKQRVFALTRNAKKAEQFESQEIQPVLADLTRPETLLKLPAAHFIVICAAPDESTETAYREIYLQGTLNLLNALRKNPRPHLVVLISSTSVWKDSSGHWVDENHPANPDTEKGRILAACENQVLQSGFPTAVLRLSGIYGPGRNRIKAIRSYAWPSAAESDSYMNMIHVRDVAASMQLFFKKAKEGEVYIGTDDMPVLRSEFCKWLAEKMEIPSAEMKFAESKQGKRLSNQKWKSLGIKLQYPSFREGYSDLLNQEN